MLVHRYIYSLPTSPNNFWPPPKIRIAVMTFLGTCLFPHTSLHLDSLYFGHITAGFMRTDSDVLSLPVMSLKMRKWLAGARLKPTVKDHITAGLWLEPAVFWRPLITAGLCQEPMVISLQKGYNRPLLPPLLHPENRGVCLGPSLHCCGCSSPWS